MAWGCHYSRPVFCVLRTDQAVTDAGGDAFFDAAPAGEGACALCALGAESVRDASTGQPGGPSIVQRFVVVTASTRGFATAKQGRDAVSEALVGGGFALSGALVSLEVSSGVWRVRSGRMHIDR